MAQTALNVTTFGAVGDAVQLYVNTTSNSVVVVTTNTLSGADIGKAIQVFDAGTVTTAPECQDLVATITNVVNGTNVYVSFVAQRTLTNTFATYGHDNRTNFQNAIDAATGTNTVINIPSGNYLILAAYRASVYGNAGLVLKGGGLHFVGAGTNETVLLSQGAWLREPNRDNAAWRGFLFCINPPSTNDYPVSLQNLTLDGGVPNGLTSDHSFPASTTTGNGWDETHGAMVVRGGNYQDNIITHQTWSNVLFRHWRGEMIKSNDTSTNGNVDIFNCAFVDGNATAINFFTSLNMSNCVFAQLFQVGEYYQGYSTNTSYLQDCLITNIAANGWSFNGGKGNNPAFVVRSNTWYLASGGYNGVATTPGDNITIQSNRFIGYGGGTYGIVLGSAGYQGTYHNSNIVVQGNSFLDCNQVLQISGATDGTGANRVEAVRVFHNTITGTTVTPSLLTVYNWCRDVTVSSNTVTTVSDPANGERRASVTSGAYGAQFALVDLSNNYYSPIYDLTGVTNFISYANGSRFQVIYPFQAATRYVLVDTNASQIPTGAQILIQNNNMSNATIPIYLNSVQTRGPMMLPSGNSATFQWTNNAWQKTTPPPSSLRVVPSGP